MEQLKYADFFNEKSKYSNGNYEIACKKCDEKFDMVGILECHMSKVHKCEPFNFCDECGTHFKRRMGLILHFRHTHMAPDQTYGKALGCDICDAFLVINGFSSYDELVDHTANIHGPETFINTPGNAGRSKCPLCTGGFTYRKGMIEHLQVTHGEHLSGQMLHLKGDDKEKFCTDRRFKCQHCDRLFTVRKSLVSHMEKIHQDYTGCKYGTATVNDDQIIFTGKSPKTPIEGKKSPSLRRKTSAISKYLEDYHVDISHNPGIQQCPKCPQVFTRKTILDMHVKMTHKGEAAAIENEVKKEEPENDPENADHPEKTSEKEEVQIKEEKIEENEEKQTPVPRKRRKRHEVVPVENDNDDGSFYTEKELAECESENHHLFYDDSVACAANWVPRELGDKLENCLEPSCKREFISWFGMMRHFALAHRPEKTASIMRLKPLPRTKTVEAT